MQKSKMAVWGVLTNSSEKKKSERQRRKGKIFSFFSKEKMELCIHLTVEFQRIAQRDKKASSVISAKK